MSARIGDAELRLRALKLKNAYDQPGLILRQRIETDRLADVMNIYEHEGWPVQKVYCSECGGHHHRRGFTAAVITAENATIRMLFGSKCGADAFGEDWFVAERRMQGEYDRQWELLRLDRLAQIVRPLKDSLLIWSVRVERVVARKSGFAKMLGELHSRLSEAANNHGGQLTVVRNFRGEFITVPVAAMRGSAFFMHVDPIKIIESAIGAADQMALAIGNTDNLPTTNLRRRRKVFENTFEKLEQVSRFYDGALEFYSPENFQVIAEWTRRHDVTKVQYRWTGEAIEYEDGRPGQRLPQSPIPYLGTEPLDLIREYRRAD